MTFVFYFQVDVSGENAVVGFNRHAFHVHSHASTDNSGNIVDHSHSVESFNLNFYSVLEALSIDPFGRNNPIIILCSQVNSVWTVVTVDFDSVRYCNKSEDLISRNLRYSILRRCSSVFPRLFRKRSCQDSAPSVLHSADSWTGIF